MAIYNTPANKAVVFRLYLKEPISLNNLDLDALDIDNLSSKDLDNSRGEGFSTSNATP